MSSHRAGSLLKGLFVSVGAGALLGALGCASVLPPLTPPEAGGAAWRELVSKHVVLRTDRGEADAREALVELERTFVALHDVGFSQVGIEGSRIVAVHFDRERDYLKFEPAGTAGAFLWRLPNDLEAEPTMLVWGTLDVTARATLQHELTHLFVRASLAGLPPWMSEGLAQYWETLSVENGSAFVGRPLVKMRAWAQSNWMSERVGAFMQSKVPVGAVPSVVDLASMSAGDFYVWGRDPNNPSLDTLKSRTTHYLGAWGLVHLLMHDPAYQPRLDSMMEQMAGGVAPRRAWELALAGVNAEEMETAYRQHMLNKFETMVLRTAYQHPAVAIEAERVMDPAEVHLLWARLRPWRGDDLPAARADVEAAVKLAPGGVEVRFWSALFQARTGDLAAAEKELEEVIAAKPKEARYLTALALVRGKQASGQAPGSEAGLRFAEVMARLAKVAATGPELDMVAEYEAGRRRWDSARSFAERAVKVDPVCGSCFATLAVTLFAKQEYGAAAAAQQIALSLLPDGAQAPAEETKLREYVEAARKQAEGTPAPEKAPAPEKEPGEAGAAEKAGAEGKPGAK